MTWPFSSRLQPVPSFFQSRNTRSPANFLEGLCLLEALPSAAVAPSTPKPQGLSRRRTAPADDQLQPRSEEASTASLAGALARERIRRRGEAGPDEDEGVPFWQKTWFLALLLVMAAASFALALLLYLGLDLPEAAPAQSYAADPESVVKVGGRLRVLSAAFRFGFMFVGDRIAGLVLRFGDGGRLVLNSAFIHPLTW